MPLYFSKFDLCWGFFASSFLIRSRISRRRRRSDICFILPINFSFTRSILFVGNSSCHKWCSARLEMAPAWMPSVLQIDAQGPHFRFRSAVLGALWWLLEGRRQVPLNFEPGFFPCRAIPGPRVLRCASEIHNLICNPYQQQCSLSFVAVHNSLRGQNTPLISRSCVKM